MLDNLNDKQKEAVMHIDGPCLVLAGAGSGKTKVLTERIINLINNGVSPSNILAITFTNKAAREMRERVEKRIGSMVSNRIFIGTFHSLGVKIIRENLFDLGFSAAVTILDSDDINTIVRKYLKEMNIDSKILTPAYVRNKISSAKNEMMSPSQFAMYNKTPLDKKVVEIYEKYTELLKMNNSVDFDDLLLLPVKLFREHKDILEDYQDQFKYILVDEYQDTNTVQYELCKLLSGKHNNLFVVGDIDQSIYRFRNADYRNVLNFERDYKDSKTILLEQNYRSTKTILSAANDVIKNNKERKEKNLWSDNEEGAKIKCIEAGDEGHEIKLVIEEIKKLLKEGYSENDIAVLYRTNAQSRIAEEYFLRENLPYKIVGSYYFYNRKEIKDLISYLRVIFNPHDSFSIERSINTPKRGIGDKTIESLKEEAASKGISLFDAISKGKELEYKKVIESLIEDQEKYTLTELIDEVLNRSGMKESLQNDHTLESDIRLENLEEFKSITSSFEERTGIVSLEEFLESIALVSDMGQYKESDNAITLMTMHSAKGLEYDAVFIIGMEEGIFPHVNSFDSSEDLEEERRLCYVGITRAKKRLYLLNAKRRKLYGRDMVNVRSRFLSEINSDLIESNVAISKPKEKMYHEDDQDYKLGDVVSHETFGTGVVIETDGRILTIAFNHKVGVKKLMKNHKSLTKM